MPSGSAEVRRSDWLERAVAAALVGVGAAALLAAIRLGTAADAARDDLLAELRARTARRVAAEREQIRPSLATAARGELAAARREAEAALGRLGGNSQLHLLLADVHRQGGAAGPALREYRRAVELLRDYADRRAPQFIGAELAPWMRAVRPTLSGAALADMHYLERALAGGCS
jgi:hypothetical protein